MWTYAQMNVWMAIHGRRNIRRASLPYCRWYSRVNNARVILRSPCCGRITSHAASFLLCEHSSGGVLHTPPGSAQESSCSPWRPVLIYRIPKREWYLLQRDLQRKPHSSGPGRHIYLQQHDSACSSSCRLRSSVSLHLKSAIIKQMHV